MLASHTCYQDSANKFAFRNYGHSAHSHMKWDTKPNITLDSDEFDKAIEELTKIKTKIYFRHQHHKLRQSVNNYKYMDEYMIGPTVYDDLARRV